jgi:hypothetical protein
MFCRFMFLTTAKENYNYSGRVGSGFRRKRKRIDVHLDVARTTDPPPVVFLNPEPWYLSSYGEIFLIPLVHNTYAKTYILWAKNLRGTNDSK